MYLSDIIVIIVTPPQAASKEKADLDVRIAGEVLQKKELGTQLGELRKQHELVHTDLLRKKQEISEKEEELQRELRRKEEDIAVL